MTKQYSIFQYGNQAPKVWLYDVAHDCGTVVAGRRKYKRLNSEPIEASNEKHAREIWEAISNPLIIAEPQQIAMVPNDEHKPLKPVSMETVEISPREFVDRLWAYTEEGAALGKTIASRVRAEFDGIASKMGMSPEEAIVALCDSSTVSVHDMSSGWSGQCVAEISRRCKLKGMSSKETTNRRRAFTSAWMAYVKKLTNDTYSGGLNQQGDFTLTEKVTDPLAERVSECWKTLKGEITPSNREDLLEAIRAFCEQRGGLI